MKRLLWGSLMIILTFILVLGGCSKPTPSPASPSAQTQATAPVAAPSQTTKSQPVTTPETKPLENPQYGGISKFLTTWKPVNIGLPSEPWTPDDNSNSRPVLEGLLSLDRGGKGIPTPLLAESWQYSSDFKTLTFNLRKGVKFQDGTDFNAEAAKYSLDKYKNSSKPELKIVSSIDVVDNNTIRLNLTSFDPAFINNFVVNGATGKIISPTNDQKLGTDAKMHPVGTGPYKFVSFTRDVSVKLERFDNYWGGKPYLDGIEYVIAADPVSALLAFKSGATQAILKLTAKDAKDLQSSGFNISKTSTNVTGLCGDSKNPNSPFSNLKVRQAIAYAIDTKTIANAIGYGFFPVTNQWAIPGLQAYNPNVVGYPYDPEKAKNLLAEAGYPNGFTINLTYDLGGSVYKDVYTAVQGYLSKVGIIVVLDPADQGRATQLITQGWNNSLMFYYVYMSIGYDVGSALNTLMSNRAKSFVSIGIPADYDAKLIQINSEKDLTVRNQQLQDLSKMIIDDYCIAIPFFLSSGLWASTKALHDCDMQTYGAVEWSPEKMWLSK
jgi:peptide/nickel transport system substrate-binding protein